ncbi:transposase [Roseiarcus sp.]|uniref:transposase n=1 Tax=Roseiarcus sp. TaxID=1969460 RepID=UPI003F9A457A
MPIRPAPDHPLFSDDELARRALGRLRWPNGVLCAQCESTEVTSIKGTKRSHRDGLYSCRRCRKQFTVTVGTVFERSKVPLGKWLQVIHLENSKSLTPLTSSQMAQTCGLAHKTVDRMKVRIYAAVDAYAGPNTEFGRAITARVSSTRPQPPRLTWQRGRPINLKPWYEWREKHPLCAAIQSEGVLAALGASDLKHIESTEKLLRLLLKAQKPQRRIPARLPAPKRRRYIVPRPHGSPNSATPSSTE